MRFGFDSMKIERELEGYSAVNMGVYAYANMRPQLELISLCAKEGDIVLHGTEFDAIDQQFCVSDTLGYEIFPADNNRKSCGDGKKDSGKFSQRTASEKPDEHSTYIESGL